MSKKPSLSKEIDQISQGETLNQRQRKLSELYKDAITTEKEDLVENLDESKNPQETAVVQQSQITTSQFEQETIESQNQTSTEQLLGSENGMEAFKHKKN